jgi:hypothetical protein
VVYQIEVSGQLICRTIVLAFGRMGDRFGTEPLEKASVNSAIFFAVHDYPELLVSVKVGFDGGLVAS